MYGKLFLIKKEFWRCTILDLVQIKIEKDDNTISYVKIIHGFDKTIPISEIKRRIDENDIVHEFDLEGNDWMYDEEMTEFEWHMRYYNFLKKLENAGAKLQILLNGEIESMQLLDNWIHSIKEIGLTEFYKIT